jgi:DNA-binding PadR family transcriptional regulator
MPDLLKKGYLAVYQERARHRARKYMISHKGKIMITRFYNILEQREAKI